jgi:hypothetical protein
MMKMRSVGVLALWLGWAAGALAAIQISPEQAARVGRKVWQNECAGTVSGLVSWNPGEAFPSLGIGHFIWYPKDQRGPFEESFPKLVNLLKERGVKTPAWISGPAPWQTRAEMLRDAKRVGELRSFLSQTVSIQTELLVQRLESALPKMLAGAPARNREAIRTRFERLSQNPSGLFALIDYVNFKGEGVLETERYKGQGWGLLQVLEQMRDNDIRAFSEAARRVLECRVKNAPAQRHEEKWLPGWLNRVRAYEESAK